ncbi:hypothetical protein K504DRAFT_452813 [Pleomassaria siparia CBS 279.74]|uniref:Uncharacterized protein n=1 Tax=Pleomassaria siparia CBS 279.74 TaxID=1314801 RepID=A0A6G1KIJ0_9PLEO|nr:hypothetical protein K504DRAFT_452813 [Pleomassaria siparia CBS 279.74]
MVRMFTINHFNESSVSKQEEPPETSTSTRPPTNNMAPAPPNNISEAGSWLDVSPPEVTTITPTTSSVSSHELRQLQNIISRFNAIRELLIISRVDTIRELLTEIQISVSNRELVMRLWARKPGHNLGTPRDAAWRRRAQAHNRTFYDVQSQVETMGDDAATIAMEMLVGWEDKVEKLRLGTLNLADRLDEEDMWDHYAEDSEKMLTPGWNWADAVAKGAPCLDDEVCPLDTTKMNEHEDAGQYSDHYADTAS